MTTCTICGKTTDHSECWECSKRLQKCPLCSGRIEITSEILPGSSGEHLCPVFTCLKCQAILRFDATQLSYEECKRRFCYGRK